MYYVYLHRKATTGEVFYVGKGIRNRAYSHLSRNPHWINIVRKHGFVVEIVISDIQEWYAFELEQSLIAYYGKINEGGTLVNITNGGDGNGNYIFTEDDRVKISDSLKGLKNGRSDKTKYRFINLLTNESYFGTRVEFEIKYGFKIGDLFKSKVSQVKNWTTTDLLDSKATSRKDFTKYKFFNEFDNLVFYGTRTEFKDVYNIDTKVLFGKKARKSVKGWRLQ